MAPSGRALVRLAPVFLWAAGAAGGAGGSPSLEGELAGRLAELEQLLKRQQEVIAGQQRRLSDLEASAAAAPLARGARRLSDLEASVAAARPAHGARRMATVQTPSIYGEISNTTRPYTVEESVKGAMTHIWLLLCGALVMFMQAGFAMVEAGCCRFKNVQNILLKNLCDVCVGTMGWWAVGYAIAYGRSEDPSGVSNFGGEPLRFDIFGETHYMGGFFGTGFLSEYPDGREEPSTAMMNWFFQWAFCSAASTIVSGGVAERVNFGGYAFFSLLMTGIIYPVVVASSWGGGWLAAGNVNEVGYMDFAGSGVVHMVGGVGALVGAVVAGPRVDRWERPQAFAPHSLPLVVLGTFILWFGWYGFNCGSTLAMSEISHGFLAAQVAMNTTLAAAIGGLVVFGLRLLPWLGGRYDIGGFCNGILAGLVSITAPCGNVACGSAVLIGAIGGLIYQGTSMLIRRIRVDDPIDAFAVHGACGAWGVLAAALFDWGLDVDKFHGWSGFDCVRDTATGACLSSAWEKALLANLAEIFFVVAWVGVTCLLVFLPLRFLGFLRASDDVQLAGFDEARHSPSKAYTMEGGYPVTVQHQTLPPRNTASGSSSPTSPAGSANKSPRHVEPPSGVTITRDGTSLQRI